MGIERYTIWNVVDVSYSVAAYICKLKVCTADELNCVGKFPFSFYQSNIEPIENNQFWLDMYLYVWNRVDVFWVEKE